MTDCSGCGKGQPNDWCWEARISDCPSGKPPRYLDVHELWKLVVAQERRIKALENPPCCKGGPQWGHDLDCATLP